MINLPQKIYPSLNANDCLEVIYLFKYKSIDYGCCKSFLKEAKHKIIITHPLGNKGKFPLIILGRSFIPGLLTLYTSNNIDRDIKTTQCNILKTSFFSVFFLFVFCHLKITALPYSCLFHTFPYFLLTQGNNQNVIIVIWVWSGKKIHAP